MTIHILEELVRQLVVEAFGGFNFNTFKQISAGNQHSKNKEEEEEEEDFAWRVRKKPEVDYAKKFLPLLGTGSSRVVFALNSSKVVKIALNQIGIAQNQAELDIFTHHKDNTLVTKIFDYSPDYKWIVSELVKELSEVEFQKYTHISDDLLERLKWILPAELNDAIQKNETKIQDSEHALRNFRTHGYEFNIRWAEQSLDRLKDLRDDFQKFLKDPVAMKFYQQMIAMKQTHDLSEGDIIISHFGRTPTGEVKLLDYGATNDVIAKHY